jgi:hypothetical protein
MKVAAKNKVRWRCVVDALCSKQELQETLIEVGRQREREEVEGK